MKFKIAVAIIPIVLGLSGCWESAEDKLAAELSVVKSENQKMRETIRRLEIENETIKSKYEKLLERYGLNDIQPDEKYKGGVFNEVFD